MRPFLGQQRDPSRCRLIWFIWLMCLICVAWYGGSNLTAQEIEISFQGEDDDVRQHGIFIDTLDVSLINVEVYVTRASQAVGGLTRQDFEVFDDGEPVEISNFFRVEAGQRIEQSKVSEISGSVASAAGSSQQAGDSGDSATEPSTVVVLVDHAFISPMSRQLVFDRLSDELDSLMSHGTKVMVVSKTRQVEVTQHPTSSRSEVQASLERLSGLATRNYASEVRTAIRSIERRNSATSSRRAGPGQGSATNTAESDARAAFLDAQSHSQQMHAEVVESLGLMHGFLGSLAGLAGRKAVLYVADRLPRRSGELVWRVWYEKFGSDWGAEFGSTSVAAALRDYDSTAEIQRLIASASANRVSVYPIGAGADAGPDLSAAQSRGVSSPTRTYIRSTESDDGLRWLARGTGGQAAIGRGDVSGFLGRLRRDLTHYYSLAYPSPHRGDGEIHRIEVRLRRQEGTTSGGEPIELRYLSEYRDKSAVQQMQDLALASLVLGLSDNPLDVRVTVGDAEKGKGGHYRVPMEIRVPVANLVLLPEKVSHWAKLSIQLIVRDEAGGFSAPVSIDLPIEIPHAGMIQALSEQAVYTTELTLRGGPQTIAVGVQDEYGSTNSAIHVDVDVGGRG